MLARSRCTCAKSEVEMVVSAVWMVTLSLSKSGVDAGGGFKAPRPLGGVLPSSQPGLTGL